MDVVSLLLDHTSYLTVRILRAAVKQTFKLVTIEEIHVERKPTSIHLKFIGISSK